jgi:hypothetical protein
MVSGYARYSTERLNATPHRRTSVLTMSLYRFLQWKTNLRILDVKEIKTVPYRDTRAARIRGPTRLDNRFIVDSNGKQIRLPYLKLPRHSEFER